ncbi:MAG: hypothetical protein GYA55_09660, partial [SAR324 cluster bacterium]|nr:hypothetical protein [SAR324 cluster bacterium]
LTVDYPPTIVSQPSSKSVTAGSSVTLSVSVTGKPAPTFQWKKNGTAISGANSSSYTFIAQSEDNGASYTCTATNYAGSVTSNAAVITVNIAPTITQQPVSKTVTLGESVTFSVIATGSSPLSYQWRKNGVAIGGATASAYSFTPQEADKGAKYSCVVSNAVGSVTSNDAVLTVNIPPSITTHPASKTVNVGSIATFTVVAKGDAPLSYQWQRDGVNISGATSDSYSITAAATDNDALFQCVVKNAYGSVTSQAAKLTVNAPPVITQQPVSLTVRDNSLYTFSVTALGAGTLSYQWQKNGVDITGATLHFFTGTATYQDNKSTFRCVVRNEFGEALSNEAVLTVRRAPIAPSELKIIEAK